MFYVTIYSFFGTLIILITQGSGCRIDLMCFDFLVAVKCGVFQTPVATKTLKWLYSAKKMLENFALFIYCDI